MALLCGNDRYQVSAPCTDQCVVDVGSGLCSCVTPPNQSAETFEGGTSCQYHNHNIIERT